MTTTTATRPTARPTSVGFSASAEARLADDLVTAAAASPRHRLGVGSHLVSPCVYLIGSDSNDDLYASHAGPLYIGSQTYGAGRREAEHLASVSWAEDLDASDFWISVLPACPSAATAKYYESLLVETCKPVWAVAVRGVGCKRPGRVRELAPASDFDVLHPGRPWAVQPGKATRTQLTERALCHLAAHPADLRWHR
jgi:hypothetical protein